MVPLTTTERQVLSIYGAELARVRAELTALPGRGSLLADLTPTDARRSALTASAGALAWEVLRVLLCSADEAVRVAAGAPTIADLDPEGDSRSATEDASAVEEATHQTRIATQADCAARPALRAEMAAAILHELGV